MGLAIRFGFSDKKVHKQECYQKFVGNQTISGMAGNFTWWDEDYGEPAPGLTPFHHFVETEIIFLINKKEIFLFSWVGLLLVVNSQQLLLLDKKD